MIFKGKKSKESGTVQSGPAFTGSNYDQNLETLEVHEMGASTSHLQEPRAPDLRSIPFSRRKAIVVSSVLTGVVLLFTGVSSVFFTRTDKNRGENSVELTSDLTLRSDEKFGLPAELQGSEESLVIKGDIITQGVIKISNGGNVMVVQATNLTANRTFSLPDVSGTFCTDANNCNYAGLDQLGQLNTQVAQLGQQLSNFELIADSGVTSVNNQTGVIAIQGSTNRIQVNTAGGVITLSTPQELDANANVQFGSLTVSPTGAIIANSLTQTGAGSNVAISAGSDSIVFTAGGRTFVLPASGPGAQTICTDGALCATGAGEAVLLSDGAAQSDNDADASIFINDTGGGHLIRLQSMGVDRLAVANNGDTVVGGSLTVSALGTGFVRSTAGALSVVSAIDLSTSDVTNTLPVNRGGTGAASLNTNGVLVGNGTSPVSSVTAGGAGLCLVSSAGAPTFTTCPGVSSLNGQSGSLTLQGTANQVSVSTAAGVITLSTPQDINTSSSPTFAALTLTGLSNGVVRASAGTLTTGLVSLTTEVSGTLPVGNGGTGTATAPANGQLLIGNGTNYTLATLTQGAGMVITNGAGSITIASAFGSSVDLGSETTGNYVATVSGSDGLGVTGGTGAGSTPSLALILQANKGLEVDANGLSLIDCGSSQILKYNGSNQWACAADETGSFTLAGDGGTSQTVTNGDTVTIQGGTNITTSAGATDTVTVSTVNNPTFTTSVTTPLLQSSGALAITPGGALTVGATGQTALLQGSTTTITSNGAGNDIVLTSANQIRFSGFDCTTFANGGTLTTDASGNISCTDDNAAPANTITGTGTANRIALYTGSQTIADSWLLQNGSTLELDNTRNLSLNGGNFSVTGTGLFSGLITANGGISVEAGDTFTFNGEAFTDLTGTGLQFSSGSLQTTLGTSVDLTTEVVGILPVSNGGTGLDGSAAANGSLLIGNGTGFTLATLTAGSGITITNSAGGIEVINVFGTSIESAEITDLTITGADIADDTITLGTKTTGNYVATVTGNAQVSVGGSGSETAAITLSLVADSIGDTQLAFDTGQHLTATSNPTFNGLTLSGNLIVEGGTATVGTATQTGTLTLSDGSSNTGSIQTAGLGQNTTFTLPDPGAATATICLSTGNCAGAGGGVTTSGGTANRIAIFNGSQTIADSWLLQNGSTLQLDNARSLELIGGNLALTSGNVSITGNQTTSGSVTFSSLTNGFLEVNGTGVVSVGTIDLGTDTAGNYVATITAGNGISGSSNTEGGAPTIALSNLTADWIQSGAFDFVLNDAGAEIRMLESVGGTFYGLFDVGDLTADQTYTFLQGGDVITSGNIASYATTAVTAGSGLTGGGTTGVITVNIGAGNGIQVNADDIAVIYGSTANTAVEGDTQITVTAGTNLTGGGTITLGAGGSVTVNVADSPTFAGTVVVQGGSVTAGTATQAGSLLLNDGSSNTGTLQTTALSANQTYTLPDETGTICLSTGNCAGTGGGVTTAGGNANRIAIFTGSQTIADSWLLQNGSTLQLDNTRNLELIGGNLALTSGNLNITGNQTTSGTVTFSGLTNGFLEVNGTGVVAVGTIDLGADTAGNYVATITAGNGINGSSSTEGGTPTIALGNLTADWIQSGAFDIVLDNSGAEIRIRESNGAFYGLFDVGDLTADQTYTFLQGGDVVTSGNVSSYATTGVTAGSGLTGGGTTGVLTLNIGAGNGITVNADDIAVAYGSAANTAVEGDTQITVTAGTNLTGGGTITLGAGGSLTVNVADSPTFAGTVNVQGATLTIGTGTQQGSLVLNDGSTNTGTLQTAGLGQNTTFTLPDPGQATADICLSTGNCAGAGSGVTTAGGTTNRLAKFTAAQSIADSTITDDGTNVTTTADLIIQGGDATFGTLTQAGSLVISDGSSNAATIIIAAHAGNYTYTIPDAGANDEFCIRSLGNCSGAGGGNAPSSAQYLTLALDGGLSAERTLSFNGTNFSVADGGANGAYSVNTVQNIATTSAPSFAGLTLTGNLSMGTNTLQGTTAVIDFSNFDVAATGNITAGTYNGQTISATASFTGTLAVAGLTTLNGGLTIEAGDTLTVNGDGFTDLTGNGLQVTTGTLTIAVQANKGLEVDASGLSLVDCADGEILKYNTTGGTWGCSVDAGGTGVGDDVSVNGSNADGANFVNTAASSTVASTTWNLNTTSSPDEISIAIGAASGLDAGILTAGAQTLGGAKTFNGQITAGAGINLGTQTLQGTTAVIDFNNFDVSAAGAVTAVGVNAGSGLLQGTGGLTISGTTTLSSLTNGFLEVNGSGVVSVGTIDLGTDTAGNYVATITAGNGISGSATGEGSTPTIALSNLTGDWMQSGAFDIVLDNASSELKIKESGATPTFYAILDTADLGADQTFILNEGGTVVTSGNVATYATTAVTAGSGLGGGGTVGSLTINVASANGGIVVNANDIALTLQANKGLEVDANGLSLVDCANGEILKYNTTGGTWGCASDAGASGTGDDVLVNGTNADGANFVNTAATAAIAGVSISLNTASTPDEIAITLSDASATLAGIVTANAQTFGGAKTFNGQIVAGAGINLGSQTLSGTTAVIDFNNFDVSAAGAVTAVGVNAGSGLIQGTGGVTVGGTVTFSSLTNGFLEVNGSGVVSVGTIDLGTDTAGNYVATITAGNGISGSSSTEGGTPTIALSNLTADWIQSGAFDIALANASSELKIMESVGGTFYAIFDAADLSADQTFLLNEGGTVVTSGNISTYATTAVTAGSGLTGGGTVGALTLNIASANGGIVVNANDIALTLQANKGLEVDASGLSLVDCANGEILKYNTTGGTWGCASDAGAGGTGDDVLVNGSNADGANFVNTTATAAIAGVSISLNTASTPDEVAITLSDASATLAGIVTANAQTFGGAKTFNGQVVAGAGINLGAQTLSGTTAVIDFNNFDVSAAGAVTAVGVNAGSGLIQGTGGVTVGGTVTFSSLTSGFLEVNGSGVVSVGTIDLGTDTEGNYVATITAGNGISGSSNTEGGTPTIALSNLTADWIQSGAFDIALANAGSELKIMESVGNTFYAIFDAADLSADQTFLLNEGGTVITSGNVASYATTAVTAGSGLTGGGTVGALTLNIASANGGIVVNANDIALTLQANKGLEVDANGLSLIDCANGEVLKYETTGNTWACASDAGASGTGDDVLVNGSNADGANFVNTTASASVAGVTISLNTATTPDEISMAISEASGTLAGIVTANAQTFGGAKTFNGQIIAGAGINLAAQTLQGTTAVIDFTNFDVASTGAVTAGTYNGQTISATASFTGTVSVAGLTTLNGGLTIETGDTLTVNGDGFTDLTGSGLQVTLGALNLAIQANKGLEVDASGLSLIDCANGEILKYNTTGGTWGCSTDAGAAGTGDDVYVNGTAISDGANFSNTAASSTAASTTWSLATASSPDAVTIAIGAASGTDAGILTAGAQTLGGAKTFNGQITAGAGVNLGTQTLQGTTAVIDFNNFDVSSAGAVTAVGVNAGSGLLQGTGGLTVAGTITLSGLTNGFLEVNGTGVVSVGTIDLGTDTAGNYVATITSGNGISAAATGEASTPTIALSNLTADWLQSGAFDIVLDNSASELKIKESGLTPTFYAILDTADLAADQTFMLNEGGTVVTSGNVATYATTAVTAGTGLTGGGTVGALTLNIASANGGIVVNANDIALTLQANKGLEVDANGLSLVDCANGEILKYNTTGGTWGCAADAGAAGTGDDVLVNGTNADGANFLNTTASASVAGVSISLNAVATPDEISLQISDASGTLAGIVTANAQTFGGNKTFNGQIVAGAGINIGATTLSGTTAVIDFNNFDVSSTGAVTAVGVNAGSGLIQGTGGITIAGTTTLSSLTNGFLEVNGTGVVSVGTIDLGTDTAGNYVATITAGNGISGSATGEGSTPTIALSNLTADWIQSGAFDIALANASSELKIMESVGGTFYAILDTADLAADQTFTLNQGGTVVTSGNVGLYATTGVTAGSGLTGGGTVGALTLNIGAGNGVSVAADSITLSLQANKGLEVDANGLSLIDCATDGYVLKYSTGTSQWACAADSDTDTTLTEAQVEGYIFDTDNVAGATSIAANANGINMLTLRRNTDTSPTGNFLSLQNAAAANLFNIDINGTVTAGTWQGSEIADAYISNSLTIASTGSVDWAALTNYPTGCAAGMAVTTIGDSLTCGSFLTAEADTLASVTGRGATTATASSFTGGATLRGLTVDTATATDDLLLMSITAGGATRFNGTITNADLTANRTYTLPDASGTLAVSASGNIALSTAGNITFTGTLPVANGGTGATTHTAGGILFGNGTSAFTNSGVLTNGQLLIGDGTGAPTVGTLTAGTGISITNGAGTITVASTITDTNTTYSAGNDLDLTGTTFDIESQLDFVSVINQTSANLTLQTTTSGNIILNSAGTIELQDNTNVTGNVVATGTGTFSGASVTIGAAALQGSLVLHDGTGQTATISLGNIAANTTLTLPAALGATDTFCFVTLANCGGAGSGVTTVGALDSQTKSANGAVISGTTIYLQTADASNPGLVSTGSQTFAGAKTFNSSVTVAANQTINLTGGTTASRPASPTEGMLYFDTTTKQLLTYSNGKWQATNGEYVIVAASNSSQTIKDAAHYVADGNTAAAADGDQVQINAALTAAAGGKVYLAQGTYVADATILIPNNTTLAGAGRGTLIELADLDVNENLIENSDTTTGTGVAMQDLRLDGRSDLNTAGTQHGIYFSGMGAGSGVSARQGAKLSSLWINNFRSYGFQLFGSNSTVSGVTTLNNGSAGFYLGSGSYNAYTGNIAQGNSYGFFIASHSRSNFTGNVAQANAYGIYLTSSTNNTLASNTVHGNTYGVYLASSANNVVTANKLDENGSTTDNNALFIDASDSNTITSNSITDSSATTTNYAINVSNSTSDTNYLADNTLGGGSINDAGTGTIYGGQVDSAGNYDIQPSGSISLLKNTDVTGALTVSSNATVSGGTLTVGAAATAANLVLHDGTGQTATINVGNVAANTVISIPAAVGATDTFCLVTLANCGDGGVLTVGTFSTTNTAANGATITGTEIIFQSASATAPGMVDTGTQTFAGAKTFNANVTVGSNLTVDTNTLFVDATLNTVGIGTAAPEFKLQVAGAGNNFVSNDAYAGIGVFQGRRANGTQAAPTALADNEVITQLSARGHDGSAFSGTRAAITLQTIGAWTGTSQGTAIRFQVTDSSTTTLVQQAGLNSDGSFVIANSDVSSGGARLRVVAHSASTIGTIIQGTSTQTADLLKLKRDTLDVLTVAGTGAVVMRNSANSTDAFQVQNASSQRVLGVNTTAGEVTLGTGSTLAGKLVVYNATNSNTVTLTVGATSASYTLTLPTSVGSANQCLQNSATPGILTWAACGGSGSSTKTVKILAEYAGGILSADGTSNTGTMSANHDSTARRNYYEWTTTQGTAQDYDVVATVQIPSDFTSIGAASGFKFFMYDGDGATTTAKVTWTVVDGSGTQCFSSDFNGTAANTWEQKSASTLGSCTFSANSEVTFRFKLTTTSAAGSIRIGGFEYQYSN